MNGESQQNRNLSWGVVIGGILLALVTGVCVTFGGFLAGLYIYESDQDSKEWLHQHASAVAPCVLRP